MTPDTCEHDAVADGRNECDLTANMRAAHTVCSTVGWDGRLARNLDPWIDEPRQPRHMVVSMKATGAR